MDITVQPATRAHLVIQYESLSWGTSLDASVTGIPAGITCGFWVPAAREPAMNRIDYYRTFPQLFPLTGASAQPGDNCAGER